MTNNWFGPFSVGGRVENPIEFRFTDIPKEYVNGDFNGDGLTDVIAIEKNTSYEQRICQGNCYTTTSVLVPGGNTYFVNLDRRITENFVTNSGVIEITPWSKFVVGDVNGDGKSDLLVFDSNRVKAYSLNEHNQFVLITNLFDVNIKSDKPRFMGDFNGDGKIDFVIPQEINTDSWSFFFSKGNGFQKLTTSIGMPFVGNYEVMTVGPNGWNTRSLSENTFVMNDFNGDGKTDILYQENLTIVFELTNQGSSYTNNGQPQSTKLVLLENKMCNGTSITFTPVVTNSQYGGVKRNAIPIFLDHNNHNQNLEYALIYDSSIRTFKSTKNNREDTRLNEIILGNGVKEVISYSPLNVFKVAKFFKHSSSSPAENILFLGHGPSNKEIMSSKSLKEIKK
jgi:hypothetical protein